jgi:hypothetical protein
MVKMRVKQVVVNVIVAVLVTPEVFCVRFTLYVPAPEPLEELREAQIAEELMLYDELAEVTVIGTVAAAQPRLVEAAERLRVSEMVVKELLAHELGVPLQTLLT